MTKTIKPPVIFSVFILGTIIGGAILHFSGLTKDRYTFFTSVKKGEHKVINRYGANVFTTQVDGNITNVYLTGVAGPRIGTGLNGDQCGARTAIGKMSYLINNETVTLEGDSKSSDGEDKRNIYRYVRTHSGELLNAEMIRAGYGFVDERYDFTKKAEFLALQTEAQQQKRGIWAQCNVVQTGNQFHVE